jgi:hypothetical protein
MLMEKNVLVAGSIPVILAPIQSIQPFVLVAQAFLNKLNLWVAFLSRPIGCFGGILCFICLQALFRLYF